MKDQPQEGGRSLIGGLLVRSRKMVGEGGGLGILEKKRRVLGVVTGGT